MYFLLERSYFLPAFGVSGHKQSEPVFRLLYFLFGDSYFVNKVLLTFCLRSFAVICTYRTGGTNYLSDNPLIDGIYFQSAAKHYDIFTKYSRSFF